MFKALALTTVVLLVSISSASAKDIDLNIIALIESSGNPKAFNPSDGAKGLHQITSICLKEYNNHHVKKFSSNDLYSPSISLNIANWYYNKRIPQLLKHYGIRDTIENRIIAYNAGIKTLVNGRKTPKITLKYIQKYYNHENGA